MEEVVHLHLQEAGILDAVQGDTPVDSDSEEVGLLVQVELGRLDNPGVTFSLEKDTKSLLD